MVTNELKDLLAPQVRITWILWGAMTVSIWAYVTVAFLTSSGGPVPAPELLAPILAGLSVLFGVASLAVPRFAWSDERLRARVESPVDLETLARDPQSHQVDPERLRRLERLSPSERRLAGLGSLVFMPMVVVLALNETIALFGLVLAFLTKSFEAILPFAVAATVLNLIGRPPFESVFERASRFARVVS